MERLPRNTEMFAPNVSCVVVLNYVLKPELLPFKQTRDFLLGERWKYASLTISVFAEIGSFVERKLTA